MRIVFMGTPEFAVPSLDILVQNKYEIAAVITAPDKVGGRGHQLIQSAIKKYALENQLPILQPTNLKSPLFLKKLQALNADLQVVVAFRMLPAAIFEMPPKGCVNVHASLLPQYRGAAPIHWAVINGETETGVTTFFIEQQIDTGKLIFQEKIPIAPAQTTGELHDQLMHLGAKVLLKTVQAIENNTVVPIPQIQTNEQKHAPKIYTDTCLINWENNTTSIYNLIRGLAPYPAAHTFWNNKMIKILHAAPIQSSEHTQISPGAFVSDNKTFLHIGTQNGYIEVLNLQLEGKKAMPIADFLRGNKIITI